MRRQNEYKYICAIDRPHDAVGVERSGDHVPRGNPASDSLLLQGFD
jgi:hypothetical protein